MVDETLKAGVAAGEVCGRCESWDVDVSRYSCGYGVSMYLCSDCAFEAFEEGVITVDVPRTSSEPTWEKHLTWEDEEEWVVVHHHDEYEYRDGVQHHSVTVHHTGTMLELTDGGKEMPRPSGLSGMGSFAVPRRRLVDTIDYIVPSHAELVVIYYCDAEIPELEELAAEVQRDSRTSAGDEDAE